MLFRRGFITFILAVSATVVLASLARAGTVSGSVGYRERIALPTNAVLTVSLQDVSLADAPARVLASADYPMSAVPTAFSLAFDDAEIKAAHSYSISARITVGEDLLFISDTVNPVDPKGDVDAGNIMLVKTSGTSAGAADLELENTNWRLLALMGLPVDSKRDAGFTLGKGGQFSASGGCNRFSGTAKINGAEIAFPDQMAGTMMACEPDLDEQEQRFLQALGQARFLNRSGPVLNLLSAEGDSLMVLSLEL